MSSKVILVTGYPTSLLARRVVRKMLTMTRDSRIRCIVQPQYLGRAQEDLATFSPEQRARVVLLEGDIVALDMGLSGAEFNQLAEEVDVIHHCATVTYLGVRPNLARQVNIGGTREVLELASEAKHLERLVMWSTALVAGNRRGFVLEDELDGSYGFRNPVEASRFRAEEVVRELTQVKKIPVTILRPSNIVGDSVTGEIDRLEGPYLLVVLMQNAPVDFRMPIPGRADTPLNLVPLDYVVDAGCAIADMPASLGRTFHLVDPRPFTARRVFDLIAQAVGRPGPRGFLPAYVATSLLRVPGLERFAQAPRAFLEQLATEVVYDDRSTRELLQGTGIECPSFDTYVQRMAEQAKLRQNARNTKNQPLVSESSRPEHEDPLF